MKEIVVLSGKGGTGKTTFTLSLLKKYKSKTAADADVDAADMFIMLEPDIKEKNNFMSSGLAEIDYDKCDSCRVCEKLCRFSAISFNKEEKRVIIDEIACEGCSLCEIACPKKAVKVVPQVSGEWYVSETKEGTLVHARLIPGAENSGKLVAKVKEKARELAASEKSEYLIADGPPGIGCPAIAAVSGADFTVIVTEPTMSGLHDLKRIQELAEHFKVKSGVIINKADINDEITDEIEKYCENKNITLLGKMKYDNCINKALNNKKFPYDECAEFKNAVDDVFEKACSAMAGG